METITGNVDIESVKRCYLEGAIAKIECPNCKTTLEKDLSGDYLSYPEIGKSDTLYFYCETCCENEKDCGFNVPMKVVSAVVTLEYDPDKITPE